MMERMDPYSLEFVPDHFKTEEMCKEAVNNKAYMLRYVPDHLKTQEMCEKVMNVRPAALFFITNCFKTQKTCDKAFEEDPSSLMYVPDHFKMQKTCDKAFEEDFFSLKFIPDWFVTQQMKIWYDDYLFDDNYDEALCWYDGHKKHKKQQAKTKEELLPITCYPDCVKDWCMSEDEKRRGSNR